MTGRPTVWPGDHESKPAPGRLVLVQALVNTVERPDGADRLDEPAGALPWLIDNRLLGPDDGLTAADLDLVRSVREALRALLVRNAGGPSPDDATLAPLHAGAAGGRARAEFGDDGEVRLAAAGDSVRERLVELLLIVRDAQRDGSWAHLKACANDEC